MWMRMQRGESKRNTCGPGHYILENTEKSLWGTKMDEWCKAGHSFEDGHQGNSGKISTNIVFVVALIICVWLCLCVNMCALESSCCVHAWVCVLAGVHVPCGDQWAIFRSRFFPSTLHFRNQAQSVRCMWWWVLYLLNHLTSPSSVGFWDMVSCSLDLHWICYVAKAGFELLILLPPWPKYGAVSLLFQS